MTTAKPPIDGGSVKGLAVFDSKPPAVHDRLPALGAEIVSDDEATPEYLAKFVKSEIAKWAVPIKESGVSVE